MSASYWVLASEKLIADMNPSLLPDGLRLADPLATIPENRGLLPDPGSRWYRFDDDNAPEELDGRRMELVLGRQGREGAKAVIIERRVVT